MKVFPFVVGVLGFLPAMGDVVGIDTFEYPQGSIDLRAGGTGWDYDQNTEFDDNGVEPGGDGDVSDWSGGAFVNASGALVTNGNSALRQYNGPSQGANPPSEERDGAFRGVGTIYYRVDMTRSSSATWGGEVTWDNLTIALDDPTNVGLLASNPIPEPTTFFLGSLGLAVLLRRKRQ